MSRTWTLVHSRRKRTMWTALEVFGRIMPPAWPMLFRVGMWQSGKHSLLGGHHWEEIRDAGRVWAEFPA